MKKLLSLIAILSILGAAVLFSFNFDFSRWFSFPETSANEQSIAILNPHSHPEAGDNWVVSFETEGAADLTITPDDQATIDDLDFISLKCLSAEASAEAGSEEERTPQILKNDVIFYPNWSCQGIGQLTHFVTAEGKHTLKFQFGNKTDYAYNSPDPVLVSTSEDRSSTGFNSRKLVRLSDGTLYTVYDKLLSGKYQVYVKRSTDNGASWTDETRISTYAGMDDYVNYLPSIAVDSNNNLHVAWEGRATGYTSADQIWYATYNGSWQVPVRISTYAGMDSSGYNQENASIAVDSNNNLHVVWDGRATAYGFNYQIWYATYNGSWQTPVRISTYASMDSNPQFIPSIAVDSNNNLHVAWEGYATGYTVGPQIWYATYNGSWQSPLRISTAAGMSDGEYGVSIAIDSNNNLHVVWYGFATGYTLNTQIWYATYNGSWQSPLRISTAAGMGILSQEHPSITVDSNNKLHVVWEGMATGYTDYAKIWYAKYTTSWLSPQVLQPTGQNRWPNARWSRYPSSNIPYNGVDYVFTNGTASPYNVYWDSKDTPFGGGAPCEQYNVWGWAWSENIGWISMSCTNTVAIGTGINYGVDIATSTGIISGYAWSRGTDADIGGIGWIKFDPSGPYPTGPNYSACLDLPGSGQDCDGAGDWKLSGWARACAAVADKITCEGATDSNAGGWDGWIKLRDTVLWDGVWIDSSVSPAQFHGWAWGGDDSTSTAVIGWISFNVRNCDVDGDGTYEGAAEGAPTGCPTSGAAYDYKVMTSLVVNQAPSASNLEVVKGDYCSNPAHYFSWDYDDDPDGDDQSAYQLQVERTSSPAGVLVDCEVPQSINSGQKGTSAIRVVGSPTPAFCDLPNYVGDINYGSDFRARVRVKDSVGSWSINWSNWVSFSTPDHAYPSPNFFPSPQNPAIAEIVTFIDDSKCYSSSGEYNCKNGASIQYAWDFDYIEAVGFTVDSTVKGNATTTYTTTGSKKIRLIITDNSLTPAGICDTTRPVNTSLPLPDWKEIPPF